MGEHFHAEIRGDYVAVWDLVLDFQREVACAAGYIHQLAGAELLDPFRDDMSPPEIHPAG